MRIPPAAPHRTPPVPTPPDRRAAPATVARLLALQAQQPGVAVLLGGAATPGLPDAPVTPTAGGGAVALGHDAASALRGAPAAPDAAAAGAPGDALVRAAAAADGDARAPHAAVGERVLDTLEPAPAATPGARAADALVRLDPAAWMAALHAPLLHRLHARHPERAVGLPHPARPATGGQLRALGRWLAARSEVATGDEELVRLARLLRLDRRLVRVAVVTLVLAALVFALA